MGRVAAEPVFHWEPQDLMTLYPFVDPPLRPPFSTPHRPFPPRIDGRNRRLWLIASLLACMVSPAAYADQAEPEYTLDGSRIFWFVQITDTHVDSILPQSEERITWALNEGIWVVDPAFVVNTGDLTDSTNGIIYGTGPHEEEWIRYRIFLEEAGLTPDFYFDLPGNHDQYGDADLSYYRQYSMWGSSTGRTQPHWVVEYPFGSYFFFGAATAGNDGAQWPFDNPTFVYWEMEEMRAALAEHGRDAELIFLFGHHDYRSTENHDRFLEELSPYGPRFYAHGHTHDHKATLGDDGIIRYRIDSLGQARHDNFAVWGIDANTVSVGVYDAGDAWPAILITAPVDARLLEVDNPYAPSVPNSCTAAPVRALVFDAEPVGQVEFRWDDGTWFPMHQRLDRPQQWRGTFDATELEPGLHQLMVSASGSDEASQTIEVMVVEGVCELGPEDPDLDELEPEEVLDAPGDMGSDLQGEDGPEVGTDVDGGFDQGGGEDPSADREADGADGSTDEDLGQELADGDQDQGQIPGDRMDPEGGCGCEAGWGGDRSSPGWWCLALLLFLATVRPRFGGRVGRAGVTTRPRD
ncbi:MAG: metallophosphoesterase [Bradymonadales bacterium]|nr:metallophosphoesterase [Bradymonadales bacterium]